MPVFATGVDITEIRRIRELTERLGEPFLKRVFTDAEIRYCSTRGRPEQSFAARFAAKEAVLKAIGTGLVKGFSWHDIEVVNNEAGKPEVVLRNKAAEMLAGKKVHLSLSHSGESAIAMVVVDH